MIFDSRPLYVRRISTREHYRNDEEVIGQAVVRPIVFQLDHGSGLVQQIYGLVRQRSIGDVAFRQASRCVDSEGRVPYTVEFLVPWHYGVENVDCLVHCGLVDEDGLEASFQRPVPFDVLSIF